MKPMELVTSNIAALLICLALLLTALVPCAAMQIQDQSSHEQEASEGREFSLPQLPRKMRLLEFQTVKGHGGRDSSLHNVQNVDISAGKSKQGQEKEVVVRSKGMTWHEWAEGTDTSQFFTMDYSNVRRRRPIHNKSIRP